MKKILFLLLILLGNLSFSEYVKEGTYNGINDKKISIERYDYDDEKGYFIIAMNGHVHTSTFKIDRYSDIDKNEIIACIKNEYSHLVDVDKTFYNNGRLLKLSIFNRV